MRDPQSVCEWIAEVGVERTCVALDVRRGADGWEVAVDGWTAGGGRTLAQALAAFPVGAVRHVLVTDISRDGTLSGVNVEATAKLARESGVAIVASGGVKSIADIEALKPYEKAGIEGVIVGKSIYMGTLDLAEAIEIAAKEG